MFVGRARADLGPKALVVVEDDGERVRCAHVQRQGEADVRVAGLAACPSRAFDGVAQALGELEARDGPLPARAALVTADATFRPAPGAAGPRPEIGGATLAWWSGLLARLGLDGAGVHPLLGAPLAELDLGALRAPALCLQVERRVAALLEVDRRSVRELELHREGEHPLSPERCVAAIGPACDELWLCGSGTDLSALGYAIAQGAGIWVRILGLRADDAVAGVHGEGLAAIRGAARQAFGLAPSPWAGRPDRGLARL